MSHKYLSIRNICIGVGFVASITALIFLTTIYLLTNDIQLVLLAVAYTLIICGLFGLSIFLFRKKIARFVSEICSAIDEMMNGTDNPPINMEEETLLSKVNHRLARLYEVMQKNRSRVASEKKDLEELLSDVSHQIKTPIANLKMINETLLSKNVSADKQIEFLQGMDGQLNKLDFLMQSMIKTSRLETGMLAISPKVDSIYETIASAIGGIFLPAEKKKIRVTVECDPSLLVHHDKKWTAEALFNILENAVKYTDANGKIRVSVERWEMYTKIDIKDTGISVSESSYPKIFKRFYREKAVHEIEGIGIGLYLARDIITLQGGYIKVASEVGIGSTFSVFLPNNRSI